MQFLQSGRVVRYGSLVSEHDAHRDFSMWAVSLPANSKLWLNHEHYGFSLLIRPVASRTSLSWTGSWPYTQKVAYSMSVPAQTLGS